MEVRMADCPLGAKCEEVKTDKDGRQTMFRCPWYVHMRGADPQTGVEHDEWACSMAWLPLLLVENSKEARQGAAATESFRNEMVALAGQAADRRQLRPDTKLTNMKMLGDGSPEE